MSSIQNEFLAFDFLGELWASKASLCEGVGARVILGNKIVLSGFGFLADGLGNLIFLF